MAKEENIQNTLSIEYGGKTIISNPFDFEAACLVDDMRFSTENPIGLMHLGRKAVNYMFRGTEATDEVIAALGFAERKKLCEQAAQFYIDAMSSGSSKNE